MKTTHYLVIGIVILSAVTAIRSLKNINHSTEDSLIVHNEERWVNRTPAVIVEEDTLQMTRSAPKAITGAVSGAMEQFQKKYGSPSQDFKVEYDSRGKLISLVGVPGEGETVSGFKPSDTPAAVARARKIIEDAQSFLGIQSEQPLGEPYAVSTPSSVKIYFKEMLNGIPLSPVGNVSLILGPSGELIRLESSYVYEVKVKNAEVKNKAQRAREIQRQLASVYQDQKIRGGNPIIWISRSDIHSDKTIATNAFEFTVGTKEVIVEAHSGKEIFAKDRSVR